MYNWKKIIGIFIIVFVFSFVGNLIYFWSGIKGRVDNYFEKKGLEKQAGVDWKEVEKMDKASYKMLDLDYKKDDFAFDKDQIKFDFFKIGEIQNFIFLANLDNLYPKNLNLQKEMIKEFQKNKVEPDFPETQDFFIKEEEKKVEKVKKEENLLSRRKLLLANLPDDLPEEKLLDVPFICQNPFRDVKGWKWHDESCEEAAVLQAILYLQNRKLSADEAHEVFLDMIEWQEDSKHFGEHKDIYADDLVYFVRGYFGLDEDEVFFIEEMDESLIKQLITLRLPVVLPTWAADLHNPYYRHPNYHMLTVIGYKVDGKAICNEVGTKRGEKFSYSWDVLLKANVAGKGGGLVIWPKENWKWNYTQTLKI